MVKENPRNQILGTKKINHGTFELWSFAPSKRVSINSHSLLSLRTLLQVLCDAANQGGWRPVGFQVRCFWPVGWGDEL